jgi:WD40 repeat protein
VYDIAFSPDDSVVAVANGTKSVDVWSTRGGPPVQLRAPVVIDHVALNHGGTALAGGSETTGSVYLWGKVTSGQRPTFLGRHLHFLDTLAFSPAGDQVASGGDDGQLRIWNVPGGSELALPSGHAIVDAVAFNSQGSSLATSDNDGGVELWPCEFCGPLDRVVQIGRRLVNSGGVS